MDIAGDMIYEDADILVCRKHAGLAVQTKRFGEPDMESLLRNYRAGKGEQPYIGVIHRLDQPVEGIMVFAKRPEAAAALNRQLQQEGFGKYYRAVVWGAPREPEGRLEDVLLKDGRTNTSAVVPKGTKDGKKAVLDYRVLERREDISLVEIHLHTGRHHQIRVQLAHAGCPLVGDRKYGEACGVDREDQRRNTVSEKCPLALCAFRLSFRHPVSGKRLTYEAEPEGEAFRLFTS